MVKIEFPEGFKEALIQLCNSYDAEYGGCVDSPYEGEAVYQFFLRIIQIKEASYTKGVTALRELGFSTIEIDQLIHVEKLRREAEGKTRKREDAMKIIRDMSV